MGAPSALGRHAWRGHATATHRKAMSARQPKPRDHIRDVVMACRAAHGSGVGRTPRPAPRKAPQQRRSPLDGAFNQPPNVGNQLGTQIIDGDYNDLNDSLMGSLDGRFGGNTQPQRANPQQPAGLSDPIAQLLIGRLDDNDSAVDHFRLFGIRTIVVGAAVTTTSCSLDTALATLAPPRTA
jgi:hypothetical protein